MFILFFSGLRDVVNSLIQRHAGVVASRAGRNLVVYIGDVAHIGDVVVAINVPQQAKQDVEHDGGARIADMGIIVDRRSADIHAHVGLVQRCEYLFGLGERVVEPDFGSIGNHVFRHLGKGLPAAAADHMEKETGEPSRYRRFSG